MNSVILVGNLTRDGEKRGKKDSPVLAFGVAVNNRQKQGDEWVDVPCFVDCVVFGKRATVLAQYLTKGKKVAISGHLSYSTWDKDGQKHSKLELVCDVIELLGGKPKSGDEW